VRLPARFQLVAAMNPCPCGWCGSAVRECRCLEPEIARYRAKISGPLLDRIDLHVAVAPPWRELRAGRSGEASKDVLARVLAARGRQRARYRGEPWSTNAELPASALPRHCALDFGTRALLERAVGALGLSMRAFVRSLRVARTIADLAGSDAIEVAHVAEAITYREGRNRASPPALFAPSKRSAQRGGAERGGGAARRRAPLRPVPDHHALSRPRSSTPKRGFHLSHLSGT
jgi:magnesium chelatase family protein